jgi:hypothetical protein
MERAVFCSRKFVPLTLQSPQFTRKEKKACLCFFLPRQAWTRRSNTSSGLASAAGVVIHYLRAAADVSHWENPARCFIGFPVRFPYLLCQSAGAGLAIALANSFFSNRPSSGGPAVKALFSNRPAVAIPMPGRDS